MSLKPIEYPYGALTGFSSCMQDSNFVLVGKTNIQAKWCYCDYLCKAGLAREIQDNGS